MTKRLSVIVGLVTLLACEPSGTNPPGFTSTRQTQPAKSHQQEAVEAMGFTDVNVSFGVLWGCSKEDSTIASGTFTAKNMAGKPVKGYVCCGLLLKGCTVRL